jgi:hypothetical protein
MGRTTISKEVTNREFGRPDVFELAPALPPGSDLIAGGVEQGWRRISPPLTLDDPNYPAQVYMGRSPMIHRKVRGRLLA